MFWMHFQVLRKVWSSITTLWNLCFVLVLIWYVFNHALFWLHPFLRFPRSILNPVSPYSDLSPLPILLLIITFIFLNLYHVNSQFTFCLPLFIDSFAMTLNISLLFVHKPYFGLCLDFSFLSCLSFVSWF